MNVDKSNYQIRWNYHLNRAAKQLGGDLRHILSMRSAGWLIAKHDSPKRRQKHLVIIRTDGIGDFVLFARDFHRLRALFPKRDWHITLVGNAIWQELAQEWNRSLDQNWFDSFIKIDHKRLLTNFGYRQTLARVFKSLTADKVIYPIHSREPWGTTIAGWIPAADKIAPDGNTANISPMVRWWFNRTFTTIIPSSKGLFKEIDHNDHFLRALGSTVPASERFKGLLVTPGMRRKSEELLREIGIQQDTRYIVLVPGAAWKGRRWPVEYFSRWARNRLRDSDLKAVICGSRCEKQIADTLAQSIGPSAISLAGRTSLIELAGILANAEECFSNETAAIHLSAAFGRPTTCIQGGGHWGRFWPYGDPDKNRTIYHMMPCFGCDWWCIYKNIPAPCVQLAGSNEDLFTGIVGDEAR